jgi:hypothetical protein
MQGLQAQVLTLQHALTSAEARLRAVAPAAAAPPPPSPHAGAGGAGGAEGGGEPSGSAALQSIARSLDQHTM